MSSELTILAEPNLLTSLDSKTILYTYVVMNTGGTYLENIVLTTNRQETAAVYDYFAPGRAETLTILYYPTPVDFEAGYVTTTASAVANLLSRPETVTSNTVSNTTPLLTLTLSVAVERSEEVLIYTYQVKYTGRDPIMAISVLDSAGRGEAFRPYYLESLDSATAVIRHPITAENRLAGIVMMTAVASGSTCANFVESEPVTIQTPLDYSLIQTNEDYGPAEISPRQ